MLYVEELIGPQTVNTMPPATIEAFKDHGRLCNSLTDNIDQARAILAQVEAVGLSMETITAQLLDEGVVAFAQALDQLLAAIAEKAQAS